MKSHPGAGVIVGTLAAGLNRLLQAEQQTVEIDGDNLGRIDAREYARVRKPAGTEVLAGS
jgi:hypothetical protein